MPELPPLARRLPWAAVRCCAALLIGWMLLPSGLAAEPPAAGTASPPAPAAPQPTPPVTPLEAPPVAPPAAAAHPLHIGTFPADTLRVIDADTLRVPDQPSIRVLGIDAEETLKKANHRAAAERDFAAYAREMQGNAKRPRKYGTPMGEEATRRVRELLGTATGIRLEREQAGGRNQDGFGRLLAHVIVLRPDSEVNLSEWLIREGLAPYFVKYGRSKRFDAAFRAAQVEAQAAKLGIWGDGAIGHYPDYDERLAWWRFRADQLERWQAAPDAPDRVMLGEEGATAKLAARVGEQATVFGSLERLHESKTSTRKILFMSHRRKNSFPVVVFDMDVWKQLDLDALTSLYLTIRGPVTLFRDRPQIVITDPAQIEAR